MLFKKKILAIILARGGSKGIKLKNLKKIKGKSLVKITGLFCKKLKFLDEAIISSDNKKIILEGLKSGLKAPFLRPKELSGDLISDEKVLIDVLKKTENYNDTKYDIVLSLPPTSPFREKKDVIQAIKLLIHKNLDSVWTVKLNDTKNHPLKQLVLKNNRLKFYDKKGKKIFARQQLSSVYFRDGSVYVIRRDVLLKKRKLITGKTGAVITKNFKISIDDHLDLKIANFLYKN